MRITAAEKAATRKRILDVAKKLFRSVGFEGATTRDIAREADIAIGTMFNYFPTKEAVVVELAATALEKAQREFTRARRSDMQLAEELFAHIAIQLRHLGPLRKFLRPLVDTAFCPLVVPGDVEHRSLRNDMTEKVAELLVAHGMSEPSSVALNTYWSLYVGIVTFWINDTSPKQEDTLALLDQSVRMFAHWFC